LLDPKQLELSLRGERARVAGKRLSKNIGATMLLTGEVVKTGR
jgi:hypothetical protein